MAGMAEVSKSPRRLYSVVRNLEWAFPATFVLGIIAVPFWSADMYAGMTLSLTAVALAFGLLRPRRVEKTTQPRVNGGRRSSPPICTIK